MVKTKGGERKGSAHLVAGLSTDVELHRLGGRSKLVGDASTFALLHYFQLSAFLPFEANSWPMFVSSVVMSAAWTVRMTSNHKTISYC